MLLEFSVKNFLSFKDKVTLSMIGNATKGLDDNYVLVNDKKVLKTLAIYGANASGKTKLFETLVRVVYMLTNSNNININEKLPIEPFKLDKKSKESPSKFEIRFLAKKIKYVYGFVADKDKIYDEYLYYYPNGRETKIFDRTKTNTYSFNQKDTKMLNDIASKTAENKFFLATATNWNYEKTKDAYIFLTSDILLFNDLPDLKDEALKRYKNGDDKLKKLALNYFKQADINIVDYDIIESSVPEKILDMLPDIIKKDAKINTKILSATFKHKNSDEHLTLEEESVGTQIVFYFIPFIVEALKEGKVIIVDELDRSLHPYLTEMIINMFTKKELNKSNAQLIFNTYDINLLKLNILRRDQIWFTEKDNNTASCDLYSLSDFSVRKDENYEKGYMLGRYGAVPFIKNDFNLWEEK